MAREPISIQTVAPEARVAQPADTYNRPYVDKDAGSGYMELAKSLGLLGNAIEQKKASEAAGQANYDYYSSFMGEYGQPNNADVVSNGGAAGLFDLFKSGSGSKMTRHRKEEVDGDRAASQDFFTVYGPRLLPFANNPQGLQNELAAIKKEAAANVAKRGNTQEVRAYGDSYFKQLDQLTNSFQADSFKAQAAEYEKNEKLKIGSNVGFIATSEEPSANIKDHVGGVDNSLISYLTKGQPESYISGLNGEFSSRISKLIAAAPPEIRSRIRINSGARTPERQAQLIADELPANVRSGYLALVKQFGPIEGTKKWEAANPAAAKARGLGHSIGRPGKSIHQHGYAIDFHRDPVAEKWLNQNAGRFGLYYPMSYEPWHIEMVGARSNRNTPQGITPEGTERGPMGPPLPLGYTPPNMMYRGWDASPNFFSNFYDNVVMPAENTTGDPGATNPDSTATGNGQVLKSVWLEAYKRVNPDTDLNDADILELRKDPKVSKEITIDIAKNNAKTLEGLHIPVDQTTLLLAHQLGAYGAAKLVTAMRQDPSMPAGSVLSPETIAANKQYNGKTVNDLYAAAANKTGVATNPVSGKKERIHQAFYEELNQSRLNPSAVFETFSSSLIDAAKAQPDPEKGMAILDLIPDEIMALPDYAAKVNEARNSIETRGRAELTFRQSQDDRAKKEWAEKVYGDMIGKLAQNPLTPISPEDEAKLAQIDPDMVKKLRDFRETPTREQRMQDVQTKAQALFILTDMQRGKATADDVMEKIKELNDPKAAAEIMDKLAVYRNMPVTITDPMINTMRNRFLAGNYKYVEGTVIDDPEAAKKGEAAALYFDQLLLGRLEDWAKEGRVPTQKELFDLVKEVREEVLIHPDTKPAEVGSKGDAGSNGGKGGKGREDAPKISTDINPANQDAPKATPKPDNTPDPTTGFTPEEQQLMLRWSPYRHGVGMH